MRAHGAHVGIRPRTDTDTRMNGWTGRGRVPQGWDGSLSTIPGHRGAPTHRVSEGRLIIISPLRFRAAERKSVAVRDRKGSKCMASRIYIQEGSKHFEEMLLKIKENKITCPFLLPLAS